MDSNPTVESIIQELYVQHVQLDIILIPEALVQSVLPLEDLGSTLSSSPFSFSPSFISNFTSSFVQDEI